MVKRSRGLTLVELMVTIAIAAILAAVALPGFQDVMRSNRLATQANEFVAAMALARSEAVRQNRLVRFCRADGLASCTAGAGTWGGWIVWADLNGDGATSADEIVKSGQLTNPSLQVLSSPAVGATGNTAVFGGDGLARTAAGALVDSGQVRVCIPASMSDNARDIGLRAGGRTVVTKATSAGCGAPAD